VAPSELETRAPTVVSKSRVELGKANVIEKRLWYDGLGRQLETRVRGECEKGRYESHGPW
jgi:hypothetical protein